MRLQKGGRRLMTGATLQHRVAVGIEHFQLPSVATDSNPRRIFKESNASKKATVIISATSPRSESTKDELTVLPTSMGSPIPASKFTCAKTSCHIGWSLKASLWFRTSMRVQE
ncbi:hypothetical protein ACJIZ3_001752 [Penstemon smallii]|uniref:Uncharacterized protein n=1 Tax=Penstemon smallii TaxID=265156 RepID=A0ABD3U4G5_9LAMI